MPGWVRFSVEDSGPGLPPQARDRLQGAAVPFESSGDGTGIGLFVIRDVLQQLGGRIEIQTPDPRSDAGQGTRFTVSVHCTLAEEAPTDSHDTAPMNILIVDDRADVLVSLSDVTRRLGHLCDGAGSADEAIRLLSSKTYDTVLIDLEMPGKDGLTLAREIRAGGGPCFNPTPKHCKTKLRSAHESSRHRR